MDKEKFKRLVIQSLESLPLEFREKLENVEIVIEDEIPSSHPNRMIVLGLYRGIPLKKRSVWHSAVLPDKITIYKKNIERLCKNQTEMENKIKGVLYHEIGHHFG